MKYRWNRKFAGIATEKAKELRSQLLSNGIKLSLNQMLLVMGRGYDTVEKVRLAATNALRRIEPETAAKAGVK